MTVSGAQPKNLLIDVQGSNDGTKPGSTPIERIITIRNRGKLQATVDLWITPSDARSSPITRWCTFSQKLPLHIASGSYQEIMLRFDVPQQAEPGFYNYDIFVQSNQYLGEQIQRAQQLRVLPSEQEAELRNEPSFTLSPPTDSEQPYQLKAGATLEVKITVENHSKRVDRFFLSFPELDPLWFTVDYPENDMDVPGLMSRTEGLQLNPNESGEVTLTLHPLQYEPAGNYSSTIRLISANRDDLILLGIFYLNILPDDRLEVDLSPSSRKLPNAEKDFVLTLRNPGNIHRDLAIQVQDDDKVFRYTVEPETVQLAPSQQAEVLITPHVRKSWQRPWKGAGKTVQFRVNIENQIADSEEDVTLPFVPESLSGKLIWQKRPSWIRWLLIFLLILLMLTGAFILARWLLRILVIEPRLQPQITEFTSTEPTYQFGTSNPVLSWEITNYQNVEEVRLTYSERQHNNDRKHGVVLVQDNASEGDMVLQIKSGTGGIIENGQCEIQDYQLPQWIHFLLPLYGRGREKFDDLERLDCSLVALTDIPELDPVTGIPALDPETETLGNEPQTNRDLNNAETLRPALPVGNYEVVLEIYVADTPSNEQSQGSSDNEDSVSSNDIVRPATDNPGELKELTEEKIPVIDITPADPPEIVYFYSKVPIYRQPNAGLPAVAEAGAEPSEGETATVSQSQYPDAPVTLNWIINNPFDIETIEVTLIHIAPDGTIETPQIPAYSMGETGLPIGLEEQCQLENQRRLICNDVPTEAEEPGEYTFTISLIMPPERNLDAIAQDTEPIQVFPLLPVITSFKVNGQEAREFPQQVHIVNPARGPINIALEWAVENRDDVTVELLPAPGIIENPPEGDEINNMMYALSPSPGETTLTLQVTNSAGEVTSQAVVINVADFVPVEGNPAQPQPVPSLPPELPAPPPLLAPSDLPPIQVPPRPQ